MQQEIITNKQTTKAEHKATRHVSLNIHHKFLCARVIFSRVLNISLSPDTNRFSVTTPYPFTKQ